MIKFFGIGSAFNPEEGSTSAYIKEKDHLIIFDSGPSTFLAAKSLLHQFKPDHIHIFITHTHTDHVGSLGQMIDYIFYALEGRANLYHPSEDIRTLLQLMKVIPEKYHFFSEKEIAVNQRYFTFYPTSHVGECYGILIKEKDQTIDYTGDCCEIKNLDRFLAGDIHTMYLDVADVATPVHLLYDDLYRLVTEKKDRERIVLMHFNTGFNKERAKLDGFKLAEKEA